MNLKEAITICTIAAKYNPHKAVRVPAAVRVLEEWVEKIEALDPGNIEDWEEGMVAHEFKRELLIDQEASDQ